MTHKSCPNGFEGEMELWLFNRGQITSFYGFNFFKLPKLWVHTCLKKKIYPLYLLYWKCDHYVCDCGNID